jgi:lysozyme family protein
MKWDEFFDWLMSKEGKAITADPRDAGGQTCWGISRRYNPQWTGWALVDAGATT